MSFDVPRYKKWRLCKRKTDVEIPACVLCVQTVDSFKSLCDHNGGEDDGTRGVSNFSALSCSFCPNDSTIFTSLGVFEHYVSRGNRDNNDEHRTPASLPAPCGFTSVWDIEAYDDEDVSQDDLEGVACMFTYSPVPCPAFSSCGNFICSVMNGYQGNLSIVGYNYDNDDEDEYKQYDTVALKCHGGNLSGKTFCCLIGDRHALSVTDKKQLNRGGGGGDFLHCELTVWKVVSRDLSLKRYWSRTLFRIFNELLDDDDDFLLSGALHISECFFSSDKQNIGILFSNALFLLIGIEEKAGVLFVDLKSLLKVTPGNSVSFPSFCFHPLFRSRFVAFACTNKCYLTDIYRPESSYQSIVSIFSESDGSPGTVNHVTYSCNGEYFSVCTGRSTGSCVYVYRTKNSYTLLFRLSPPDSSTNVVGADVSLLKSSNCSQFSPTSEELIAAYSDGAVRVWQLPRRLNLKELCRIRCLCLFERSLLEHDSRIPKRLKNYLFFVPEFD